MSLQLDFNAFKNTPLALGPDARVLGHGAESVVVADRGTALKLYTAGEGISFMETQMVACREATVLKWLAQHNDTGIKTPKPLEFQNFRAPVEARFGDDTRIFVAALRMEKLELAPPPFSPNWQQEAPEAGSRFFRNHGKAIAAFNNLAMRMPVDDDRLDYDPMLAALKGHARRGTSRIILSSDIVWMLQEHERVMADKPAYLCHGDLHTNNVSYNAQTQKVTAVIDWASATMAAPGRDLSHYAGATDDPAVIRRNQLVREGYHEAISRQPDPQATLLYALMHKASAVLLHEAQGINNPGYQTHVVQPYFKTLAVYLKQYSPDLAGASRPAAGMQPV